MLAGQVGKYNTRIFIFHVHIFCIICIYSIKNIICEYYKNQKYLFYMISFGGLLGPNSYPIYMARDITIEHIILMKYLISKHNISIFFT